jgi:hypothetical protein
MKRFSFPLNFVGRIWLQRIKRHIAQAHCKYDIATGLFIPPDPDSPFWIIERTLVFMEDEFEAAKRRKRRSA